MLTIGAFARLGGVSPRALRHYEAVGILLPASIGPTNGYRRYRADQLTTLQRIQALQDLGLSLQQLRPLLEDSITSDDLAAMLRSKRVELMEQVADARARLERVERRLRYLETEDEMSIDFTITRIQPVRVAQVRGTQSLGAAFGGVSEFAMTAGPVLATALDEASVERTGPLFLHYEEGREGALTPILAAPIGEQPLDAHSPVEVVDLPALDAVTTIYRGSGDHELIAPIYGQMARYAEDHGFTVDGPGRDHIVSFDERGPVLELQLPVMANA